MLWVVDLVPSYPGLPENCKIMFCSTSEVYGNGSKDGRKDPLG